MVFPTSGYGQDYITDLIAAFNASFPGVKVTPTEMKEQKTQLQPRFVSGDVPDAVFVAGLDIPVLTQEGQVADLTPLFEAEAIGFEGKKLKDVVLPGVFDAGVIEGTPRMLQYTLLTHAYWYSKKLFDAHGWVVPKDIDGWWALCAKIKEAGIAPMAYQGQYPSYLQWSLITQIAREVGRDGLNDMYNLKEGSWNSEGVVRAAQFLADMRSKGYFLEGTEGLDHTQSQTYWVQGKAAFVPCGGWIEVEMGDQIPEDFELTLVNPPLVSSTEEMPYETIIAMPGSPFMVPEKAKNKPAGLELLRTLASKEYAQKFTKIAGTPVALQDYMDPNEKISPGVDTQLALMKAAGSNTIGYPMETWYPKLGGDISSAIGELARGALSGQEWADKVQKMVDATREDSTIPKFTAQ